MHIGHYAPDIWAPGGVSSYMRRVGRAQAASGDTVSYAGRTDPGPNVPEVVLSITGAQPVPSGIVQDLPGLRGLHRVEAAGGGQGPERGPMLGGLGHFLGAPYPYHQFMAA